MIFDRGSVGMTQEKYDDMNYYMGKVDMRSFRGTGYYELTVAKPSKKEEFKAKYDLDVKTVDEVLDNWKNSKYLRRLKGRVFIHREIEFDVWHELKHQNYSVTCWTKL